MRQALICCALGLALGLWCDPAPAQPTGRANQQTTQPTTDELLQQLLRRLDSLEKRHEEDQHRIEDLERRLTEMQGPEAGQRRAEELEEEVRSQVEQLQPSLLDLSPGPAFGAGNVFNPMITIFTDVGGSISSRGGNKALNRFNLREVEVDFRAAISPEADGVLILAIEEEIEVGRNGDVEIDRVFDVEEGYIDFHTLPYDLSARVGKFRNQFGRNNVIHTHDLPQVTRPLAVRAFFGPEGMSTTGVSLSWLVPNAWDEYIELTTQVVNADGGEESPILGGPNADNPAVLGRIKWFTDVTDTSSFELGGSYLFTATSDSSDFDANVFGLDLTYTWADPDPSTFRSLILQGEVFWGKNDVDRGFFGSSRNDSLGAYAFAQYQFDQNWYVGLRGDYTEFPNSESRGTSDYDVGISPYLSWYLNEWLRARLEYQHRIFNIDGDSRSEEALFIQFTSVFGAHPPHPYWVNR